MPIYEYRCSICGEKFEKLVRSSSGPVEVRCPNCDAERVERQLSIFGFSSGSGPVPTAGFAPARSSCGHGGG